jgi:hypothetical protein
LDVELELVLEQSLEELVPPEFSVAALPFEEAAPEPLLLPFEFPL